MKDGKTLRVGDRYEIVYTLGICSLEVATCEPSDAGKYTCVAENSQGTEESTCKVTVNGKRSDHPRTACSHTHILTYSVRVLSAASQRGLVQI